LLLCNRCHRLAELERIRVDGVLLPFLTMGHCLTLKSESDEWQPELLAEIRRPRRLPDLEPLPKFLLAERERWKRYR
jgi:hypothetical protein